MRIPVVIVDDEEVDRLIASKRIERSDWSDVLAPVHQSESGDKFLEAVRQRDFLIDGNALILMDINMPGRNGFETVQDMCDCWTGEDAPDGLVVMMFTSSENPADIATARTLEVISGFIVKPLDDQDIETIAALCNLKRPGRAPEGTMLH